MSKGQRNKLILFPRPVARSKDIRELVPGKALIKMLSEVALGKVKGPNGEEWAYGVKERLDAAKILLPKIMPDLKAMQLDVTGMNGQQLPYEVLAAAAIFVQQQFGEQLEGPAEEGEVVELEAPAEAVTGHT